MVRSWRAVVVILVAAAIVAEYVSGLSDAGTGG
jgi:hypothetical protein